MEETKMKKVILAGNPNVGKSTVFNQLTGQHQHTGNWPGKTVAFAEGFSTYKETVYQITDVPGCYSLMSHSAEEEVARDCILKGDPDAVMVVCDATCLERNLNLVLQIKEIAPRVLLCVNLMDEARKKGIVIHLDILEQELSIPAVGIEARNAVGIEQMMETLDRITNEEKQETENTGENIEDFIDDTYWEERTTAHVKEAERIAKLAVSYEKKDYLKKDRRLDSLFTSKRTGFPIMFLMLLLIFWITIVGANYPSQLLSNLLFAAGDKLEMFFQYINLSPELTGILVQGMYRVLAWVVSVMLPPMAIFFPLFTILEDFGYLPRVAYNLDKCFHCCRACGKQALTMMMGFGCNAAGVVGCRIIDSPRERLIAIITNSFVPCNGRFPTMIALITIFFAGSVKGMKGSILAAVMLSTFIMLGVAMTFFASFLLSKTVLKGEVSSFTLELPPYRRPKAGQVIIRSIFDRTIFVLMRAVAVAAPAGCIIWLMANIQAGDQTLLSACAGFLDPFGKALGMDGTILIAFILGFPANEIVVPVMLMAYLSQGTLVDAGNLKMLGNVLYDNGWTWVTAVCVLLFSLMHWPCSTTCLSIKKETGSLKWTALSVLLPTVAGMILCFLFSHIAGIFPG